MTVDEMCRELQRRLKKNRFVHSIGVANVAGLLDDCAREFDMEQNYYDS